jgi:subtilisin family serine protease
MDISIGSPQVAIAVIDGPIDFSHPAFQGSNVRTIKESQAIACKSANSIACIHGTFVTGILCAKRGSPAPAICPGCQIILYPVFTENDSHIDNDTSNTKNFYYHANGYDTTNNVSIPSITPRKLSDAIIEIINAGAKIINLSLGLSTSSLVVHQELSEAYSYACKNDVIIVIAAGNQGSIGYSSLLNHPWVIPVAACDEKKIPTSYSNLSPSIGIHGLMAPGVDIKSTSPNGSYVTMTGTSFSAPIVTGAIALLWSIFPKATATQIKYSVMSSAPSSTYRRTIIPPMLNVEASYEALKNGLII